MNTHLTHLNTAFGDCKQNNSNCIHKSSYQLISNSTFYIYDDTNNELEPVQVVGEHDDYQLKVENKTVEDVCLIKTDKCLFTDEHKKCDCILFNANKYFFVEISEAKNRNKKRKVAVKQLETTIKLYKKSNIDLTAFSTKAIICFKHTNLRPTKASRNTKRGEFVSNYNIELEEGSHIIFD